MKVQDLEDWVRSELEYAKRLDKQPGTRGTAYIYGRITALREVQMRMEKK